ncbi:MAG: hypothetical protein H5T34_03975 [Candidatus Methanomethyliales bacterium]|nr:hypothetical protein [Candidatus Methanomethylicales archaeon]
MDRDWDECERKLEQLLRELKECSTKEECVRRVEELLTEARTQSQQE